MDPKGNVLINKEFVHTKIWPANQVNIFTGEVINLEAEYKEALAGKLCTVIDIAVDGEGYLVLAKTKKGGDFLWAIEKKDTKAFIPVIKKNGVLMPAGLSQIEEFAFIAKSMQKDFFNDETQEKDKNQN